jgi:hypothetical protein
VLNPLVTTDRDAFLAAVEADDVLTAVTVYDGDFLPQFAAPGAREFEQWADGERTRLRRLFVHAADRHVRLLLAKGRAREAVPFAKRARDTDPDTESAWRLLLETLIAARDSVSAAAEADALERYLREDEREPEPATRVLLRLARQPAGGTDPQAAHARATLQAELVGRVREFSAIMSAWDSARAGTACHVHVSAPAGLGKSRLLEDVAARLRASRARVVAARALPGERTLPYAFAAQVARELAALPGAAGIGGASAAALVALHPALSSTWSAEPDRATGDDAMRRRAVALGELLDAVADEAPVALLLDDLHWADDASWRMLQSPIGRLQGQRVLVVTSARPTLTPAAHDRLRTLVLPPLDSDQVAQLVASLGALPDAPWVAEFAPRLVHAAEGSPLFVLGMLQDLLDRGLLHRDDDSGWRTPDAPALLGALEGGNALRRRLEQLDRAERWILALLAVAGVPLAQSHVAEVARQSDTRVMELLDALEGRGLVVASGDAPRWWQPAHDAIAEDVLETLGDEARRAAHAAIGRLFAATLGEQPGMLLQAGPHLVHGRDDATLSVAFRTLVTQQRRRGIRTTPHAVARDLLGAAWSDSRERQLMRALPWRERPQLRWATTAAIGVLAMAAGIAYGGQRRAVPAGSEVVAFVLNASSALEVSVTPESLATTSPLDLARQGSAIPWQPWAYQWADQEPNGTRFVTTMATSGPLTDELVMRDGDAPPRTLASHVRDDNNPHWSPNSQELAFATARWNPTTHFYNVAVLDMATERVRRAFPYVPGFIEVLIGWSPDGTTLYAGRRSMTNRPNELCRIGRDGRDLDCVVLDERADLNQGAVLDASRLALRLGDGLKTWSTIFDWQTRRFSPPTLVGGIGAISRDGRWVLCEGCDANGNDADLELVYTTTPDMRRRVLLPAGVTSASLRWRTPPARTPLAGVTIEAPASLATDGTAKLNVRGRARTGDAVPLARVRWISRDASRLVVDREGTARGVGAGTVWVVADAYGVAMDSAQMTIIAPSVEPLLQAGTSLAWQQHFRAFGDPMPRPVLGADGVATIETPNDDPSYAGGVYSRVTFSPERGMGLEAVVRVPRTKFQWQYAGVAFESYTDTAALRAWDHRTGGIKSGRAMACMVSTILGEGFTASAFGGAMFGQDGWGFPTDSTMHSGRPVRLRAQLFEDGRCGVAVNGSPVGISAGPVTTKEAQLRAVFFLHSHETRVRIGPAEVWRGVKRDIDWSRAPVRRTR